MTNVFPAGMSGFHVPTETPADAERAAQLVAERAADDARRTDSETSIRELIDRRRERLSTSPAEKVRATMREFVDASRAEAKAKHDAREAAEQSARDAANAERFAFAARSQGLPADWHEQVGPTDSERTRQRRIKLENSNRKLMGMPLIDDGTEVAE